MTGGKAELWVFLILKGEIAMECKPGFITNLVCLNY